MKRLFSIIALLTAFSLPGITGSSPEENCLIFRSYESAADERTSLQSEPFEFSGEASVSFDLKIDPNRENFGYICRFFVDGTDHLDILLTNPVEQLPYVAIIGCDGKLCTLLPSSDIFRWNHISLSLYNDSDGRLFCSTGTIKDIPVSRLTSSRHSIQMLFGVNGNKFLATTDAAPMMLKQLSVDCRNFGNEELWPLASEADLTRQNSKISLTGRNMMWSIDPHRCWKEIASFSGHSKFFITDDPDRAFIYIIEQGRLIRFNVTNKESEVFHFSQDLMLQRLSNDFCTLPDGTLAYLDVDNEDFPLNTFDFKKSRWQRDVLKLRHSRFDHHNTFINPIDSNIVQMFGYAYHLYNNEMHRVLSGKDMEHSAVGIPPRYMSAVGLADSVAFIIGGKGNESGIQELGPSIFSDIWQMNLRTYGVTKVGEITNEEPLVPAQNLIREGEDTFYGLMFNPNTSHSWLELNSISVSDGTMTPLADSIPYIFLDTESYAILTSCNKALYATATYKDSQGDEFCAKVYELKLPVVSISLPGRDTSTADKGHFPFFWIILSVLLICSGIIVKHIMRRQDRHISISDFTYSEKPLSPGIYLLGGFRVIGNNNNDISTAFSPMMKQLLVLLILYTSRGKGVSNAEMKDILWEDKTDESYFNNRGVTLKKIRVALSEVSDSIEIVSEGGYWLISLPEDMCDYFESWNLSKSSSDPNAIVSLANRGILLPDMRYEWLDKFKSDYSDRFVSALSSIEENSDLGPEAQLKISSARLLFDNVDEDAMRKKCQALIKLKRAGTAKSEFDKFKVQYFILMGEEFGTSFKDFISG